MMQYVSFRQCCASLQVSALLWVLVCLYFPCREVLRAEELALSRSGATGALHDGFLPAPIDVPEGFSFELAAGPPLVTHPTMAAFDDRGRLYVCNNSGVNMSNQDLEKHLPNSIRQLVDEDGDGCFDSYRVFADKMTFPMGGVWHDGSLYVASPPNIWRLTDIDDDGVADRREAIVSRFGYNGNAASIHGCFFGPEGRLYWTDGYHGHEFKDKQGNVTSQREGSYLFSCRPDGSDKQIHCGGGMDNPVEIDFTDAGDMLGTVNILYTRPRVDCLVHWLHGGAYPHRERVLNELKVSGPLLTPSHRFGHVAVSGMTRYRSDLFGAHWTDNLFVTFFNSGKVVRLKTQATGSTYEFTQHEFLSSASREFHPTDVLEDADGSLLVVDTGGWFYRGCPTSQFAKPELLGGIYRIRRDGKAGHEDPRGLLLPWGTCTATELLGLFADDRHVVREKAVNEAVKRGAEMIAALSSVIKNASPHVRRHAILALGRLAQDPVLAKASVSALMPAVGDSLPELRQLACRSLGFSHCPVDVASLFFLLQDSNPHVRRQAQTTLGMRKNRAAVEPLVQSLTRSGIDRSERHAVVYALVEIGDAEAIRNVLGGVDAGHVSGALQRQNLLMAISQIDSAEMTKDETLEMMFGSDDAISQHVALQTAQTHPEWGDDLGAELQVKIAAAADHDAGVQHLFSRLLQQDAVANLATTILQDTDSIHLVLALNAIAEGDWKQPREAWVKPVYESMLGGQLDVARAAIAVAGRWPKADWLKGLRAVSKDQKRPVDLRMDALASLHAGVVQTKTLTHLLGLYRDSRSPTESDRAAQIIGNARLDPGQLELVIPVLSVASPGQLRDLIRPFQRQLPLAVADQFLTEVNDAAALLSLSEHELSDVIKHFPRESMSLANKMLDRLKKHHQEKLGRLEQLRSRLGDGDANRGRTLFAAEKAKCSSCHRVGGVGQAVGPDLNTIGANRSATDLLESIVFPSASIVRDYSTYKVLTVDGRAFSGVLVSESSEAIQLQQASGKSVRILRSNVERIDPGSVSIMPAGLEQALTEDELVDIVKYLQSLR
ncbi:MAG: hypothetical protein CMM01_14505 [Rhodopirellula sp.]|nr:hypothetical protein [Rhodopirellula sp.]